MPASLLSTLAGSVGACPGLRSYLATQSAHEFAEFLRVPRLHRIYQEI